MGKRALIRTGGSCVHDGRKLYIHCTLYIGRTAMLYCVMSYHINRADLRLSTLPITPRHRQLVELQLHRPRVVHDHGMTRADVIEVFAYLRQSLLQKGVSEIKEIACVILRHR